MIQWVVLEVSRVKVQYKHNQLDMDKDNEKDFCLLWMLQSII